MRATPTVELMGEVSGHLGGLSSLVGVACRDGDETGPANAFRFGQVVLKRFMAGGMPRDWAAVRGRLAACLRAMLAELGECD